MSRRYDFLDAYRGLIVLLMIEGHVVREFLQPVLQISPLFRAHELLHGITGPGFLFGAGITFGISAQRRWEDFLRPTPVLARRMGKIFLLIIIGYALHLPFLSLQKTLRETSAGGWTALLSFDVLQCIGFSLLILQLLLLILRGRGLFLGTVGVLGTAAVLLTPVIWRMDLQALPAAVSLGLQGTSGSVYPIVPYSAFLFAGAVASYRFTKHAEDGNERVFLHRLALGGLFCILAGFLSEWLPLRVYEEVDFWHDSPNFFLMKLGGLFLLMSGTWVLNAQIRSSLLVRLSLVGIESLFVYIVHLVVLYGSPINAEFHLSSVWSGGLGWFAALGVSAVLMLVLYGAARMWRALKLDHPVLFRAMQIWIAVVLSYEFLTSPY
ncbi:MAG: DUF1624 domain-containing protein [Ignavibacteriales bacterium]|nr:DUF1624 domain-containing protein [Ignavibacteriales bacterium]